MAISFVGSHVGTHNSASAQTVNFSSLLDTAGGTPTLLEGDYVLVAVENASTVNRTLAQLLADGYKPLHTDDYRDDNNDSNFLVMGRFMGATPDTNVAIPGSNATTAGVGYGILVLRGVDPMVPMDATPVVTGAINTGVANPAAILPVTAGAWIVEFCGAAVAAGAVFTIPGDLSATTNHFRSATITTTTNDANIGFGIKTNWSSGSFDGAAFGGSTSTNTGSWSAVTLAIKPLQSLTVPYLDANNSNALIDFTSSGLSIDPNALVTPANDYVARATTSKAAGKWYFEATMDSKSSVPSIGLVDSSFLSRVSGNYLGVSGNHSIGFFSNGNVGVNGGFSATTPTWVATDVVRIAFDMAALKVWVGVNGTWDGDPAAGTGGHTIPFAGAAYPALGLQGASDGWTANFGATSFAQSVPTGFSAFNATGTTLTPSLFTNTQTFHAPTVTPGAVTLTNTLVTNTQTFYGPTVSHGLTASLLTNSQTFYGPTITTGAATLTPSLFTNTQSFFAPTVSVGAVDLTPGLFTNAQSFFDPTATATYSLTPSLFTNTNSFFAATASATYDLTPSPVTNTNTFYAATVSQPSSGQDLEPSLHTNTQTFFDPTAAASNTLAPSLVTNTQTFHSPTISVGAVTLTPSLFTNTNTFFDPVISAGGFVLQPSLFTNSQSFFNATVTVGAISLAPSLVTNTSTFFAASVSLTLAPSLVTNTQTFFGPTISVGATTLLPALFTNTNSFFSASVGRGAVNLSPLLLTNTQTFFGPSLGATNTVTPPLFVNDNEIFPPLVNAGGAVIEPGLFTNVSVFFPARLRIDMETPAPRTSYEYDHFETSASGRYDTESTARRVSTSNPRRTSQEPARFRA